MVVNAPALAVALIIVLLFISLGASLTWTHQHPSLKILTYSSFMAEWGPGPLLQKDFEAQCDCQVQWIDGGDGHQILLKLQAGLDADVVMGLDQMRLRDAMVKLPWQPVATERELHYPVFQNTFVPYNWAPMAFVADMKSLKVAPPRNLQDLMRPRYDKLFALQDPRVSSPGLQFAMWWSRQIGGEFAKIRQAAHSVSPSWSMAYGLMQKGHVPMVFSYATSPIYHRRQEGVDHYQALRWPQAGHPVQVEYMAIPRSTTQTQRARQWLQYVLSVPAQKVIFKKNFMLPARKDVALPPDYQDILDFPRQPVTHPSVEQIERLLLEWR